jgi:hypothetical protein
MKKYLQATFVWALVGFLVGLIDDLASTTILCRPAYEFKLEWFLVGILDHALPETVIAVIMGAIVSAILFIFNKKKSRVTLLRLTWLFSGISGILILAILLFFTINGQPENCVL